MAYLVSAIIGNVPWRPVQGALKLLRLSTEDPSWTELSLEEPLSQNFLSKKIEEKILAKLLEQASIDHDIVRLHSVCLHHAGDWLNAVPSRALGLSLHPHEFIMSACYRLGVLVYDQDGTCPECNLHSDSLGDHSISCGADGNRKERHDRLRDAVFSTAKAASLAPKKEAPSLIPGRLARPGDIYLPLWRGFKTAFDITVINPLQKALIHRGATSPGHALKVKRDCKLNLYL
jgi:hypothetical protein